LLLAHHAVLAGIPPDDPSFLSLAHRAPLMIWMSGLDMGCFYFNRAWLNFRGRLLAQEYGKRLGGRRASRRPRPLRGALHGLFRACVCRFVMKYRLRHYSGDYHWILDRGTPHYSLDGRFPGLLRRLRGNGRLVPGDPAVELRTSLAGVAVFRRDLAEVQLDAPVGSVFHFPGALAVGVPQLWQKPSGVSRDPLSPAGASSWTSARSRAKTATPARLVRSCDCRIAGDKAAVFRATAEEAQEPAIEGVVRGAAVEDPVVVARVVSQAVFHHERTHRSKQPV